MRVLVSLLALSLLPAAAVAEEGWLPPTMEEGAARQLASRVKGIGAGTSDEARLSGARRLVGILRGQLESWGEDGVVGRAPRFSALAVPVSGSRHLDAIARFQVCNMVLMLQLRDPAFAGDPNARMTSVTGLTAFTLAVMYLRRPFLKSGGSDARMEAFLTGPSMAPVLEAIQGDPARRGHAERQCMPPLLALMKRAAS
jgi:hypothetical protein